MRALHTDLIAALDHLRLAAVADGDNLTVEAGTGRRQARRSIGLDGLAARIDAHPAQRRAAVAGFASGVAGVVKAPHDLLAASWGFVEAAGRLVPAIEHATFGLGVIAAGGEPPWTVEFVGELVVAYYLELDRGVEILTRSRFEGWAVTPDRVTCAGRSLLCHKTMSGGLEPFEATGLEAYRFGDGYDAARALVMADVDYQRCRSGVLFAIPHPHILLVRSPTKDGDALDGFQRAVDRLYEEARYPLSRALFAIEEARTIRALGTDRIWPLN